MLELPLSDDYIRAFQDTLRNIIDPQIHERVDQVCIQAREANALRSDNEALRAALLDTLNFGALFHNETTPEVIARHAIYRKMTAR